jgi:hypothetical protein
MTCRIDRRVTRQGRVTLCVSGRITAQSLAVLRGAIEQEVDSVALDLKGVLLVDGDAVRFLAVTEAHGVELRNCPAYVREWMARETAQVNREPPDSEQR